MPNTFIAAILHQSSNNPGRASTNPVFNNNGSEMSASSTLMNPSTLTSGDQSLPSMTSCDTDSMMSDLGIDKDKLPIPVMTTTVDVVKNVDKIDLEPINGYDEKSVEEHEDESAELNIRQLMNESKA